MTPYIMTAPLGLKCLAAGKKTYERAKQASVSRPRAGMSLFWTIISAEYLQKRQTMRRTSGRTGLYSLLIYMQ